ncbi:MAG: beta-lactamase family protein [Lachnospiraceae bacterium]|nr:beta-lactamase family protein [Lachnospiraceae bacterium]
MRKKVLGVLLIMISAISIGALAGTVRAAKTEQEQTTEVSVDDTVYCVGSVSKVYVTLTVMQLVDQGKVELDAPVTDYLPDFKMADERYKDITVRMLMNHTSGLMGTSAESIFLLNDTEGGRGEAVLKNLADQRLKADPGAYAAYCNDGYDLLQLIVERVTGMEYSAYVEKYVAKPLGADSIGTGLSLFGSEKVTYVYQNGVSYGKEYCTALGAGGIYSTVRDTCEFGSAFFTGDHRLLSEQSKKEMNALSVTSPYQAYGLGWDVVTMSQYEKAGVKVVAKGGDTGGQHTALIVAPEQQISVCVSTSGGSSGLNSAMAKALMNIVLEEQGITVEEVTVPEAKLAPSVPGEYQKYEGYYATTEGLAEITFPEMKYMLVKYIAETTSEEYYAYSDLGFVRVKGDVTSWNVKQDINFAAVSMEEKDGKVYLVSECSDYNRGLLRSISTCLDGEKMEVNPVSEKALAAWKAREELVYENFSEKYSSENYLHPNCRLMVLDGLGYVLCDGLDGQLRIVDEDHLESFTTIPDDANRDQKDIWVDKAGNLHSTTGLAFQPRSVNENFTTQVTEVHLSTGHAAWYNIDDSLANSCITIERPENSAVYVYDRFGEVLYSSQMVDYHSGIPLPKGGYIVFAGEDGGVAKIDHETKN